MKLENLKNIIKNKWVKRAIQLLIILSCTIFIYQNLKQIDFHSLKINYWLVLLSLLFTMVGTFLGAVSWWTTLRAFGQQLKFAKTCDIQFASTLAKYIPGYGWQLVGKGYMSIDNGVPSSVTGTAIIFEYIEIFLSGLCLAVFALPTKLGDQFIVIRQIANNDLAAQIVSVLLLVSAPLLINILFKTLFKNKILLHADLKWTLFLVCLMIATWIINSYGFHLLLLATGLHVVAGFRLSIFVLTITYLIGLLIIIVPGSIGVREALLIYWLSPFAMAGQAGIIALAYRVITIASEVLVFSINNLRNHLPKWVYEIRGNNS